MGYPPPAAHPLAAHRKVYSMHISFREVRDSDLPVLYSYSNEPEGIRMAAFTWETRPTAPASTPTGRGCVRTRR